jgi:3-hydroxyacyl-CoA dehydrogenase
MGFEQFAVHMDDPLRARPLVKIVDVLGTQKEATAALGQTSLQVGKRPVRALGTAERRF